MQVYLQTEPWHILLSAMCHVYEHFLLNLADLDEVLAADPDWDSDSIVTACVDPATKYFGKNVPASQDLSSICGDFLARLRKSIELAIPVKSARLLAPALDTLQERALNASPIDLQVLDKYLQIGQNLSRDCYLQVCAPDHPNLSRTAGLSIAPRNSLRFRSGRSIEPIPNRAYTITFEVTPPQFNFDTFVNLPFFFLHEYFSHIHSSEMCAEQSGAPPIFEDGWLLHAAHLFYCASLKDNAGCTSLSSARYRKLYADKYIYEATSRQQSRWVRGGCRLADEFERAVGADIFWRMTLELALVPWNSLPGCPNLHGQFLSDVRKWLEALDEMSPSQKREAVERLRTALEGQHEPGAGIVNRPR